MLDLLVFSRLFCEMLLDCIDLRERLAGVQCYRLDVSVLNRPGQCSGRGSGVLKVRDELTAQSSFLRPASSVV